MTHGTHETPLPPPPPPPAVTRRRNRAAVFGSLLVPSVTFLVPFLGAIGRSWIARDRRCGRGEGLGRIPSEGRRSPARSFSSSCGSRSSRSSFRCRSSRPTGAFNGSSRSAAPRTRSAGSFQGWLSIVAFAGGVASQLAICESMAVGRGRRRGERGIPCELARPRRSRTGAGLLTDGSPRPSTRSELARPDNEHVSFDRTDEHDDRRSAQPSSSSRGSATDVRSRRSPYVGAAT